MIYKLCQECIIVIITHLVFNVVLVLNYFVCSLLALQVYELREKVTVKDPITF